MDIYGYLGRIGYTGSLEPTPGTLKQLHRAHMLCVPFENLDIFLGRPIVLDVESFYEKIVTQGRGGYCFEQNSLFAWLLTRLGFSVKMLSAQVVYNGLPGPEFDHMVLLVQTDKPLIADVGFGDSFIEPIGFDGEAVWQQGFSYCLEASGDHWVMKRQSPGLDWTPQYMFSSVPRQLSDFSTMNEFHQHSPDSIFTRKVVCSKATMDGRITLSKNRLILTAGSHREERAVANEGDWRKLLNRYFDIDIADTGASIPFSERGL